LAASDGRSPASSGTGAGESSIALSATGAINKAMSPSDHGGFYYTVAAGDWVSKIAGRYGFSDWKLVWYDERNADLRVKRPDPNLIYPGDPIYVPSKKSKEVPCSTDQLHEFQLTRHRKKLKIVLREADGTPRCNVPCVLEIDSRPLPEVKQTGPDGRIEALISDLAESGMLLVGQDRSEVYPVRLGHLDPIETIKGYQERLTNLGHYSGEIDGIVGPLTRQAVRGFQELENFIAGKEVLVVDGIMGPKTQAKLKDRHGY
jgi:hypothetical protein